jgi:hypothetical protein
VEVVQEHGVSGLSLFFAFLGTVVECLSQLVHVRTGSVKAVYAHSPSHVAGGVFKGQFKTCLRIHPSCTLDPDILVLTFVVMEKKRRDSLGDQVNVAAAKAESVAEASAMEGGGGGLM